MRRGLTLYDAALTIIILAAIVSIVAGVARSVKQSEEGRVINEIRSMEKNYVEIGKTKCKSTGVGTWREDITILGRIPKRVIYSCSLQNGRLYKVKAKICDRQGNKCSRGSEGYVYID